MEYNYLHHFSYNFIGQMKKSLHKNKEDLFLLRDFDITKMKLSIDDSMSSLSIIQLKEIVCFVDDTISLFKLENNRNPTYADMRARFK